MAIMTFGRRFYGLGALVLGIPGLIYGDFAALGLPVPAHIPGYSILIYASAGLLVLAGLAINVPRAAAIASLALAALFASWLLAVSLPGAFVQPTIWVSWEGVAETMVMALGGVLAFIRAPSVGETRAAAIVRIARPVFGAGLMVFGTSEFVYARFTASLVPAWLPPSQLFWTYVTGAAQIAAGLAIASGVQARLAAILLTAMYLGFALFVHLPRVIAHPSSLGVWAENGVNLVLAGAAWVLADTLGKAKARGEQAAS
jgi:uncharacterized membrane protein YphA (DoxX/SURF4 family)